MERLCLLVLLIFIPPSLSLQCWNQNSDRGSWYIQTCTANQTSCVATYHVEGEVTSPAYFACSSTVSRRSCLEEECNPMITSGSIYSCCCRGDLCNTVTGVTPFGPVPVVEDEPDKCARLGCNQSCIVYDGNATCLCRAGYSLSQDGRTCEDTNECLSSPCGGICVNTEGSYHCECPLGQRLADDGFTCEETGLVCQYQSCNSQSCPDPRIQYCDYDEPERSRQICQATYTRVGDGSFRPGLLSCFSGLQNCGTNTCTLYPVNDAPSVYFCCCTENLCNVQVVFPNETEATPSSRSVSPPLTSSVPTSVSVEQTEPLPPTSSVEPHGATTAPATRAVSTEGTTQYDHTWTIVGVVSSFVGGVVLGILLMAVFYNRKNFLWRGCCKSNSTSASQCSKEKEFNLEDNEPNYTVKKHRQFQYHHL